MNYALGFLILTGMAGALFAAEPQAGLQAFEAGRYEDAFQLLNPAAKDGDADAQYRIGWMYEHAKGVSRDYEAAADWYFKAAAQDNADAQCALGGLYEFGQGVECSRTKAVACYEKAAAQGHEEAKRNLEALVHRDQKTGAAKPVSKKEPAPLWKKAAQPTSPAATRPDDFQQATVHESPMAPENQLLPYCKGSRRLILNSLEKTLLEMPNVEVVAQGAWIQNMPPGGIAAATYVDPLVASMMATAPSAKNCRHDLRMILRNSYSPGEAAEIYRGFRERLVANLQGELSRDAIGSILTSAAYDPSLIPALARKRPQDLADIILRSTNLYPPQQLLNGVANEALARETLAFLGAVPNLGNKSSSETARDLALLAMQGFDPNGRVLSAQNQKVMAVFTDLLQVEEKYGQFGAGGYSELANQSLAVASLLLKEQQPELAVRHLMRARRLYETSRVLAQGDGPLFSSSLSVLDQLIANPENKPEALKQIEKIQGECVLLEALAREGSAANRLAIVQSLLQSNDAAGPLLEKAYSLLDEAGGFVRAATCLESIFPALREPGRDPGVLGAILDTTIQTALSALPPVNAGVNLINNFIAATHKAEAVTASGLPPLQEIQNLALAQKPLPDLAAEFVSESEAQSYLSDQVTKLARSRADLAQVGSSDLTTLATAALLSRWKDERAIMIQQGLLNRRELEMTLYNQLFTATVTPENARIGGGSPVDVVVQLALGHSDEVQRALDKLSLQLSQLGGPQKRATLNYVWQVDWLLNGKPEEQSLKTRDLAAAIAPHHFQFNAPGKQDIKAICKLIYEPAMLSPDARHPPIEDVKQMLGAFTGTYQWEIPIEAIVWPSASIR